MTMAGEVPPPSSSFSRDSMERSASYLPLAWHCMQEAWKMGATSLAKSTLRDAAGGIGSAASAAEEADATAMIVSHFHIKSYDSGQHPAFRRRTSIIPSSPAN